jgi:alkylation response protein AidB-like acyl-CoA dehydrogenase
MDIRLSADQVALRDVTRRFLDREHPVSYVRSLEGDALGFDRGRWAAAARLGWASMLATTDPAELRDGVRNLAIVVEECGRSVIAGPLIPVNIVIAAICLAGTPAQRQRWLPGLTSGGATASWCLAAGPRERWFHPHLDMDVQDGPEGIRISGTRRFAEYAGTADILMVSLSRDADVLHALVPADAPGISISPLDGVDIARRYGDVLFENVLVTPDMELAVDPAGALLGELHALAIALQAAETAGMLEHVFGLTMDWGRDRVSFGRPLASYQAIKHQFADLKLALESSLAVAAAAVNAVASADPTASELASIAKSYTGQLACDFIQQCMQLHGGIGLTWEHDLHLYLRRAMTNRALLGSPADHRERIAVTLDLRTAA